MEELIYQIKGVEVGSLRIGSFFSPSTQWMPSIVATFLEKHPNIDLRIFEGTYDEVMAQLVRGRSTWRWPQSLHRTTMTFCL